MNELNAAGTEASHRPSCHTRPPFHCDCEDTFDLSGTSLTVTGLGTVDAGQDGASEHFVVLRVKSEVMNLVLELEASPDVAHAIADKIHQQARQMETVN